MTMPHFITSKLNLLFSVDSTTVVEGTLTGSSFNATATATRPPHDDLRGQTGL